MASLFRSFWNAYWDAVYDEDAKVDECTNATADQVSQMERDVKEVLNLINQIHDMKQKLTPLWGGVKYGVLESQDPGLRRLREIEAAKTPQEVFAILRQINSTEQTRINSPLLDLLFKFLPDDAVDKKNEINVVGNLTSNHLMFLVDRGLVDPTSTLLNICELGVTWYSHKEVAALLLDRGANLHAEDDKALWRSAEIGWSDMVKLLLDRGALVNAQNGRALRSADEGGHVDVVQLLLNRGANVRSAIRWAAANGYKEVVKMLRDLTRPKRRESRKTNDFNALNVS